MKWKFNNEKPIYSQIMEQIKSFIIMGVFECGSQIPSVRELAADAGVNPNTMQRALTELEREGLLYVNKTVGRFVTDDKAIIIKLKEEFACNNMKNFILNMEKIGYCKDEILYVLQKYIEGEDNL